jgi:hypothetical protein
MKKHKKIKNIANHHYIKRSIRTRHKELLRNKLTNLYEGILFFNNSKNQRIVKLFNAFLRKLKGKRASRNSQVISKHLLSLIN